jgi:hypothetical protein
VGSLSEGFRVESADSLLHIICSLGYHKFLHHIECMSVPAGRIDFVRVTEFDHVLGTTVPQFWPWHPSAVLLSHLMSFCNGNVHERGAVHVIVSSTEQTALVVEGQTELVDLHRFQGETDVHSNLPTDADGRPDFRANVSPDSLGNALQALHIEFIGARRPSIHKKMPGMSNRDPGMPHPA